MFIALFIILTQKIALKKFVTMLIDKQRMATPIKSIISNQQYDMIFARVSRSWINNDFNTGCIISRDYILVDEEVMILFLAYIIIYF